MELRHDNSVILGKPNHESIVIFGTVWSAAVSEGGGVVILPESVKIGPIVYTIEQPDSIVADDGSKCLGQIRYSEGRILVRSGMPPVREAITFWHEIAHAILENTGQGEDNEGLVDALSYGIVDLFERNGWRIETE